MWFPFIGVCCLCIILMKDCQQTAYIGSRGTHKHTHTHTLQVCTLCIMHSDNGEKKKKSVAYTWEKWAAPVSKPIQTNLKTITHLFILRSVHLRMAVENVQCNTLILCMHLSNQANDNDQQQQQQNKHTTMSHISSHSANIMCVCERASARARSQCAYSK